MKFFFDITFTWYGIHVRIHDDRTKWAKMQIMLHFVLRYFHRCLQLTLNKKKRKFLPRKIITNHLHESLSYISGQHFHFTSPMHIQNVHLNLNVNILTFRIMQIFHFIPILTFSLWEIMFVILFQGDFSK